jgi:GR25 family glycosyltransferase involved in LPS biosynthesis
MKERGFDRFDGIVYINLSFRTDRKEKLLKEFAKLDLHEHRYQRIEAYFDELNGTRGCALSHVGALNLAIEKGWNSILVLEDDCRFNKSNKEIEDYIEGFYSHFESNWDVFLLGTDVILSHKTTNPDYLRVIFSMRAHSYVVNGHYIEALRDLFYEAYKSMQQDIFYRTAMKKAIDRRWVDLQQADRWYVGVNKITMQEACYSDIEKSNKSLR